MAKPSAQEIARAVLRRYPKSPADRLKIDVPRNTPALLYQWLLASLLFSARIAAAQAEEAARALFEQGWRTPKKMAGTTWKQRVDVLNRSGYARYDESTARYIGDSTDLLIDRFGGDLRKLRTEADRKPAEERALLKQFKGIGDVGADIFFRETQVVWDELYPFADKPAIVAAGKLGLGDSPADLARLVGRRRDLPRLLAALVSVDLAGETDVVLKAAA